MTYKLLFLILNFKVKTNCNSSESINDCESDVRLPTSNRIQAIMLKLNTRLIFKCYTPRNRRVEEFDKKKLICLEEDEK